MALEDQVNRHIAELSPYEPGKPLEELAREFGISDAVKLASNESPLGPSPRAVEAVREAAANLHRYPDGSSFDLRAKLAERLDVGRDQLIFGAGSDEVIELLAKALLGAGDEVVFAWPSFAMYPIVTRGMGATPVQVPLDAGLVHDLPAMARAVSERTKLVIVCNPNNPTGTSVGADAFDRFLESLPEGIVVAIDEAYIEFARRPDMPDALAWVGRRPGIIALRTFSKLYGLAGLRVGYGVTDAELAGYLERSRHPFNVNRLGEVGALAALDDAAHVERTLENNRKGLDYLSGEFDAMGIEWWPSDANFVLARTGADTHDRLLREGVIVRPMEGYGMPDCIRVSVGTPEENARFGKALRRIREVS